MFLSLVFFKFQVLIIEFFWILVFVVFLSFGFLVGLVLCIFELSLVVLFGFGFFGFECFLKFFLALAE